VRVCAQLTPNGKYALQLVFWHYGDPPLASSASHAHCAHELTVAGTQCTNGGDKLPSIDPLTLPFEYDSRTPGSSRGVDLLYIQQVRARVCVSVLCV
jgi:hypothetical protein